MSRMVVVFKDVNGQEKEVIGYDIILTFERYVTEESSFYITGDDASIYGCDIPINRIKDYVESSWEEDSEITEISDINIREIVVDGGAL